MNEYKIYCFRGSKIVDGKVVRKQDTRVFKETQLNIAHQRFNENTNKWDYVDLSKDGKILKSVTRKNTEI